MTILMMGKTKINYKKTLTYEQYRITQENGTETPYTGKYCNLFESGTYLCICCSTPLFNSDAKYDSGSGWPDFHEAITEGLIYTLNFSINQRSSGFY